MAISLEDKMKAFITDVRVSLFRAGIEKDALEACIAEAFGKSSFEAVLQDAPPLGDFSRAYDAIKLYIYSHCPRKPLSLDKLRLDGGTQLRTAYDQDVIDDYARRYSHDISEITDPKRKKMPPVVVFYDGTDLWLADGFYRVLSVKQLGWTEIWAEVKQGTLRDAILYACGANTAHGAQRTNDHKRQVVKKLLADEEWQQWSNEEIARHCNVSNHFVGDIRKELAALNGSDLTLRKGKDGKVYNTENIGKRTRDEAAAVSPQSSSTGGSAPLRPQPSSPARLPKGPSGPKTVNNEHGLILDKYYPTRHDLRRIYNDPFAEPEFDDLLGTLYDNCYLLPGAMLETAPRFSDYEVVEALRPIPNPDTRYQSDMKARCENCSKREGRDAVYENWLPAQERGKWRCPKCGFVRPDPLMDIIEDEVPLLGEGNTVLENLVPGYSEISMDFPDFADRLVELGKTYGWAAPQMMAAAFLPILKQYRQVSDERDKYARQLREIAS